MATPIPSPIPIPRWRVWFLATRPWSLTISVVPILLASALAWQDGRLSLVYTALMLLVSILTQIGCNLTNDYFDNESGVDLVQNEGQGRMLQDGHLTDRDLRNGMIASFALALLFGVPIIFRLGWIGVLLALVGAGVAFFYTGGPWPLAYNRMGEIGVFAAMGLVMVGGAYYVHTGTLTWPATLLAVNVGLYAAGILHSNNMRDFDVDLAHDKRTVANTLGWVWGVREYVALMLAPLAITVVLVALDSGFWPLLASFFILPATIGAIRHMRDAGKGGLTSEIVGMSSKLHLGYGVITTFALIAKGVIGG